MRRVVPPIAPGPDLGRPEMLPPARDLLLRDGQVRPSRPPTAISRTRHACGTIVLGNRYRMACCRHRDHQKRRGR